MENAAILEKILLGDTDKAAQSEGSRYLSFTGETSINKLSLLRACGGWCFGIGPNKTTWGATLHLRRESSGNLCFEISCLTIFILIYLQIV